MRLNLTKVSSKRRNPIIAEVFAQLDYMEKRGSGLRKIINETAILPTYKEDKIPSFDSSRSFFYTTIPNVNYGMDRSDLENFANSKKAAPEYRPEDEIKLTGNCPYSQKNTQKTYPDNDKPTQKKIGKTAQAILDELVADPHLTRTRLAEIVGKSEDTVKLHLSKLQARGILLRIGPDNGGFWKVLIRN